MPSLTWIGKDAVLNHHLDVPYRVLEKKYDFGDGEPGNKIIHGDNLEALKSLLPEYEGRVKCIYIDPPYNTGNENWVYNDNVNSPKIKKWLGQVVGKESEDLTRHDKWLCMMYPRLKLLQKLLSNDGAIFISIDDNEQANLKLVCDEIFGAGNFVCTFVWQKRYSPPPDTKDIGYMHENVLMYRKTNYFKMNLLPFSEEQISRYQNPDNDPRGPWKATDYTCRFSIEQRPNLNYPILNPNTNEKIWPNKNRAWAMSLETHKQHVAENRIYWGVDGKNRVPALKNFLSEVKQGRMPNTLLNYLEVGHTQEAKKEIKEIFDGIAPFDTPKPVRLIEHLIQIVTSPDSRIRKNDETHTSKGRSTDLIPHTSDIILDSFAGSGTTAHAVLNLNKQDGGNRKFILVEMEDYAETITAERVRRVIGGYGEGKNAVEGTGGSFAYYELGPELLKDGFINEDVPEQTIREYLYYTETNHVLPQSNNGHPAHLGNFENVAYYFLYNKDETTTLDATFLASISEKADRYVIYADNCIMPQKFLFDHDITFKKIPRDIRRF